MASMRWRKWARSRGGMDRADRRICKRAAASGATGPAHADLLGSLLAPLEDMARVLRAGVLLALAACALGAPAGSGQGRGGTAGDGAPPSFTLFTPEQDIEIGQRSAAEAERQLPMLDDASADRYVDALVKKLAAQAPGPKFPYRGKAVNDPSINAFALPGGPTYVNRGLLEAARS